MSQDGSGVVEFEVIDASEKSIRALKSRLPGDLVEALAQEVISRVARIAPVDAADNPSQEMIAELAEALISADEFAGSDFIRAVRDKGASAETVYLKYLAEAARVLGVWWEVDRVTFAEVINASSRIYGIMRGLRRFFERPPTEFAASALFATVPGEIHTLGVNMAADMFRGDGWDVVLKTGLDHDALVAEIEKRDCRFIGLSVSGQRSIEPLSRLVVALQICRPATPILVAGQAVRELEDFVDLMGVDGMAETMDEARAFARALG